MATQSYRDSLLTQAAMDVRYSGRVSAKIATQLEFFGLDVATLERRLLDRHHD